MQKIKTKFLQLLRFIHQHLARIQYTFLGMAILCFLLFEAITTIEHYFAIKMQNDRYLSILSNFVFFLFGSIMLMCGFIATRKLYLQ